MKHKLYDKVVVLLEDDTYINLKTWQNQYGLTVDSEEIGKFFKFTEEQFMKDLGRYGKLVVCAPLMKVMDKYRELIDEPVKVNAYNRDHAKQLELIAAGLRAAKQSPHEEKMAVDMDTLTEEGTYIRVAKLRQASKAVGIPVRIGFKDYLAQEPQQTFIHLDVCPLYFGKGMPRHYDPHPIQWESQIEW